MSRPEESDARPGGLSPAQTARLASRLANAFVLDMVTLARDGRPVLDTLLISTISQANVAPILQKGDLQIAYAGADEVPPDELRRPISVNALAASLGLPFETVRRRIKGLMDQGICVQREGGVVVPAAVFTSPYYLQNAFAAYERLRRFYYEMRDLGMLAGLPPPTVKLDAQSFPIRTVVRLVTDYILRAIDTMTRHVGDAVDVLIILQLFRVNTEGFDADMAGGEGFDVADMIPDRLRRPAPNSAVARALGLPQETVRRHAAALEASGRIERVRGGLIVPARALGVPQMRQGLIENYANLQRLFASLSQLGVLAIWDGLEAPASPPVAAAASAGDSR